jgi:hypothetical protein
MVARLLPASPALDYPNCCAHRSRRPRSPDLSASTQSSAWPVGKSATTCCQYGRPPAEMLQARGIRPMTVGTVPGVLGVGNTQKSHFFCAGPVSWKIRGRLSRTDKTICAEGYSRTLATRVGAARKAPAHGRPTREPVTPSGRDRGGDPPARNVRRDDHRRISRTQSLALIGTAG